MKFLAEQKIRQIFSRQARDTVERKKYGGRRKTRLDIGGETVEALYFRKFSAFIRVAENSVGLKRIKRPLNDFGQFSTEYAELSQNSEKIKIIYRPIIFHESRYQCIHMSNKKIKFNKDLIL